MADLAGALGLDFLTQVVNVHWGGIELQGLLAEYPPGPGAPQFENIQDVMKGIPTAHALDSGISFKAVNMGASGLGHTVLTRGLVCFGKPKNGDACFIACPGFKYYANGEDYSLKRGTLNTDGELEWSPTGARRAGRLIALSFAADAFFAVHYDFASERTTVAMSLDGESWSSNSFEGFGGVVAAITEPETTDNESSTTYISVGDIAQESEEYANRINNLYWAAMESGTSGVSWDTSFNSGMLTEPGTWFDLINNYACTVAGSGTVAGKRGVFIAAAATKGVFEDPENPGFPRVELSAAAAVSTNGSVWKTISLKGLPAGLNQRSWGLAATYVKSKKDSGYFLLSDHELYTSEDIPAANSNLYRSSDGRTWSKIRTNLNWMSTLSAVAKDLSKTTIVHV